MLDDLNFYDEDFIEPEIADLIEFFDNEERQTTNTLTKKRIDEHFQEVGEYLNNVMVYPDLFVDLLVPKRSHFRLYPFQRIMMRCMARGTATYETLSRGTSKSFIADLERYLHCMFVPRHNTTITAGTIKQAAEIAKQKFVNDLWVKFPLLANEMQRRVVAGKKMDPF